MTGRQGTMSPNIVSSLARLNTDAARNSSPPHTIPVKHQFPWSPQKTGDRKGFNVSSQRLKDQRLNDMPGPGTYVAAGNPFVLAPPKPSDSKKGSHAFASRTTRKTEIRYTGPGPGEYVTRPQLEVRNDKYFNKAQATSSFAKAAAVPISARHLPPEAALAAQDSVLSEASRDAGAAGGGAPPLAPPLPALDETPGPAAYAPPPVDKLGNRVGPEGAARGGHASAFRNTGHQPLPLYKTLPPGTYELVRPWASPAAARSAAGSAAAKADPPTAVGLASAELGVYSAAALGARFKYPSYQMRKALSTASLEYNSGAIVGFNASNAVISDVRPPPPGPGTYETHHVVSMAAAQEKMLERGARAHSVAAARAASPQRIDPSKLCVLDQINYQNTTAPLVVPGPGAYDDQTRSAISQGRGPYSGFRSATQRAQLFDPKALGTTQIPGPAYYQPKAGMGKKSYNWRRAGTKSASEAGPLYMAG